MKVQHLDHNNNTVVVPLRRAKVLGCMREPLLDSGMESSLHAKRYSTTIAQHEKTVMKLQWDGIMCGFVAGSVFFFDHVMVFR
jgi:hypothetical protein